MFKRRAEIWDQIEFFGENYNNYQMYAKLAVDGRLDEVIFKKAVRISLDVFPILRSRYSTSRSGASWIELPAESVPEFFFFVESPAHFAAEPLLPGAEIDVHAGPQIMVRFVREEKNDSIGIIMNHMICDAAGFKLYLYELAGIYSRLSADPDYRPDYVLDGNRNALKVYGKYIENAKGLRAKAAALFQIQRYRDFRNEIGFAGSAEDKAFICSYRLEQRRFKELKAYSRDRGVTINDIFLAAFSRAVALLFRDRSSGLVIPFMVDLRRLLPGDEPFSLCNLTSMIRISPGVEQDESPDTTVKRIHEMVRCELENPDVLNGYLFLLILFELLPYRLFRRFIDRFFKSFPIAFSNLGIIDAARLRFGETGLRDCFMTGSIKRKPCFWMAISSFDGTVTLTVNLEGSEADRDFTERFLQTVDRQLPV